MKSSNMNKNNNLQYGVDDNPSLITKIFLGFHHIFAAFEGIIVVPLVMSSVLGFDLSTYTVVISETILASGIATIIQARGVGRIGSKVACIRGTDFATISQAGFMSILQIFQHGVILTY